MNPFKKIGQGLGIVGPDIPDYGLDPGMIDRLISAYRQAGMTGLQDTARKAKGAAVSRLAASGMEPSLALQQALFNPILQQIASARAGLTGQLAGTEFGARQHAADMQFQGDLQGELAEYQQWGNFLGGLTDIGGQLLTRKFFPKSFNSMQGSQMSPQQQLPNLYPEVNKWKPIDQFDRPEGY